MKTTEVETLVAGAGNRELARKRGGVVRRLVTQELRRTWRSYVVTATGTLLFGMLGSFFVWTVAASGTPSDSEIPYLSADIFLLLLVGNLSLNWLSRSYATIWEDPFSRWLGFLRTLPVPTRDIASARAWVMLGTAAVMTCIFFLPFYLLNGNLSEIVPPTEYLWFVCIWAGYSLLLGGLHMYLEFGIQGKVLFGMQFLSIALLVAGALLVNRALGAGITEFTLNLADDHGPLAAAAALAAGLTSIAAGKRATTRRLQTRSFPS